jgi:hypothetical protein
MRWAAVMFLAMGCGGKYEAPPAGDVAEVNFVLGCDWVPACAGEPCSIDYAVQCGAHQWGTYTCGEQIGFAFDDGTEFSCPQGARALNGKAVLVSECGDVALAASHYCDALSAH